MSSKSVIFTHYVSSAAGAPRRGCTRITEALAGVAAIPTRYYNGITALLKLVQSIDPFNEIPCTWQ